MSEALSDDDFRRELTQLIAPLRAFARSMCAGDPALADDMAQDALARAWARRDTFLPGTNMKAWLFTILRNGFYTDRRNAWRHTSMDPDDVAELLVTAPSVEPMAALDDLRRGLALLAEEQREALILVGAGGLSYEEAAEICGAPVGTIKSRVNRARAHLQKILDSGVPPRADRPASDAMDALMDEVEQRQWHGGFALG